MTTKPYSELLEQVEALAGATLATAERSRVKIFANRRARHAHRECPYWPRFLRVGEERIVSDTGLLPLTETGKETIDQIIRIHAQDPFKQDAAFEYTEYYEDSTGIQITGYQPAEISSYENVNAPILVSGDTNPDYNGVSLIYAGLDGSGKDFWSSTGSATYPGGTWYYLEYTLTYGWLLNYNFAGFEPLSRGWADPTLDNTIASPLDVPSWAPIAADTGNPVLTRATLYSAFVTYLAAPAETYGDGDGDESDVPSEWFEYMAQGAYADWLRSDGQTEKALAEEVIAEKLLNQQLEKVSRQNGNQVITRQLSHGNMQWR